MANKLYNESSVQAIADAIREKTGSTDTYTVAQMGEAIREMHNVRAYTGEITETVVGSGVYAVLAKDDFLAEHRDDDALFVRVEFDIEPTAYTIFKIWAFNAAEVFPSVSETIKQYVLRYGSDGATTNTSTPEPPINTDSPSGVGCLQITEDGELRIYSNSAANYAIRPSKYTVLVEW